MGFRENLEKKGEEQSELKRRLEEINRKNQEATPSIENKVKPEEETAAERDLRKTIIENAEEVRKVLKEAYNKEQK
ncbi:MAG TPA: hypothetical protein P5056_02215 [Candidatus Paceibacterota bacterium]|nr:hypothetical protein [Candidatus Paceibacterota bacterium]